MNRLKISHLSTLLAWSLLCLCALGVGCQAALAKGLHEGSDDVRINRIDVSTDVGADLLGRTETLIERQALSERGAGLASKYVLAYDKDQESLEILEAYTLKPDGRKLMAGPEGVMRQSAMVGSVYATSWPQSVWLQVSFPDVQKNDKTVVRMLQTSLSQPLDGWFSIYDFLSPDYEYESYRFRLSAPNGFALSTFGTEFHAQHEESNDKQLWTIQGAAKAREVDEHVLDPLKVWPHIIGSSLKAHEQLAEAFAHKNADLVVDSPEVMKLVEKLTWGIKDQRVKAQIIYDWVRDNIRYVAVDLGTGGWRAHAVDWVLLSRYGDCKDHSVLLQTMLQAANIQAVPVLLNTGGQYSLPELPSSYSFNHAMVYLPQLEVFVDSTSTAAFGELPWVDLDKPVAVALRDGAQIMRTPVGSAQKNTMTTRSLWKIAQNGSATLELRIDASGPVSEELKERLQQMRAEAGNQMVRQIIQDSGFKGTGNLTYPAVPTGSKTQSVRLQMDLRGVLPDKDVGVINPNPPFSALPIFIRSQYNYAAASRAYSQPCVPVSVREEFEMQFSPSFKLSRIPENFQFQDDDGVRFSAEYQLIGNTLKGVRTLVQSQPRHVCTPEDYAKRKPAFDVVTRQLKNTLLYQQ